MDGKAAAELAYGLLWHMNIDTFNASDRLASEARRTLIKAIGKEGQGRGIQAAKEWLKEHGARPYAPEKRNWTWRQMMEAWPEDGSQ